MEKRGVQSCMKRRAKLRILIGTIPIKVLAATLLLSLLVGGSAWLVHGVPKYFREQQEIRDSSIDCNNYRDFLKASAAWEKEGDIDQARGVFELAIHHFKRGRCTQFH